MKTNFNLKKKKSNKKTLVLIVVRWNNQKLTYSTQEFIHPKFWEDDKMKKNFQRAKITREFPEYPEFNFRLDSIEANVNDVFRQFLNDNDNKLPTVKEFKELLDIRLRKVQNKEKLDLFGFIKQLITDAKNRYNTKTGKIVSISTIVAYQNCYNVLREYSNKKRQRIDFDTIDLNFYHEYTEYLTKELNLANNTVGKHIKNIKTFMNDAYERGLHNNISFRSRKFKVISEQTNSTYLDEKELDEVFKLDLSANPKYERVRDLFIVGCWTGLRFSDFSNIQERNIVGDSIEISTIKTGEVVIIPIHKTVAKIMEKYKGKYPNSLPPSVSNAKTNKYLKEIGKLIDCLNVGFQKKITKGGVQIVTEYKKHEVLVTHTARRSFATNLYKSGLSSITIMKITGHRTERAFLRYIKVTPNENAKLLQQHWIKMENTEKQIAETVQI